MVTQSRFGHVNKTLKKWSLRPKYVSLLLITRRYFLDWILRNCHQICVSYRKFAWKMKKTSSALSNYRMQFFWGEGYIFVSLFYSIFPDTLKEKWLHKLTLFPIHWGVPYKRKRSHVQNWLGRSIESGDYCPHQRCRWPRRLSPAPPCGSPLAELCFAGHAFQVPNLWT